MAIRLEKSGELMFIRAVPDPPVKKRWWDKKPRCLGLWVVLTLFIAGILFAAPVASGWPALANTVKGLIAAVW